MTNAPTGIEIAKSILSTYEGFAQLFEGLDDDAWRTPTRCDGWEVRDVASHVTGLATDSAAGDPAKRTPDEHAAALRDHAPAELAAQLRTAAGALTAFLDTIPDEAWDGPSPDPDRTLAEAVAGLWFDTYMHDDDVRAALGVEHRGEPDLLYAVTNLAGALTRRGWGPASLALSGMPPIDIGAGGEKITGDPYEFVLVVAGRADANEFGVDPSINIYAEG